ncbi:hypothetical protein E2320_014905 [Naja naja]|nr:hypothetical protein E2320_014905 [Naja naja]
MRNDIAWHGTKIYIPKVLQSMILKQCHDVKQRHAGYCVLMHPLLDCANTSTKTTP